MLYDGYEFDRPDAFDLSTPAEGVPAGAGQLHRGRHLEDHANILGERVLGLPGEPRVDKDLPWSAVPRS